MLKTEVTLCPLSFTTQSIFVLLSFQCFHCSHQVQVDSDSMKRFKLSYSQVLFFASTELNLTSTSSVQLSSATQSCSTLWDPIDCSTPGFPVHAWSLFKLMFIESVMPSNHLILCRPLLLLPSVFPSINIFYSESVLHITWSKCWSFSFSISPSNEYSGLISIKVDWLISLLSRGLLRVFFNSSVQFFGVHLSLWSNSHICTWLLEKPELWLDRPLSSK